MELFLSIIFFISGLCSNGFEAVGLFIVSGIFAIAFELSQHK